MSSLSDFLITAGQYHSREFTSSGTFIVPTDVHLVYITGCAAGGGGGGGADADSGTYDYGAGGGGSGEHIFRFPVKVTPEESISVYIGAGGYGGAGTITGNGTDGGDGYNTTFGDYLRLIGGSGGLKGVSTSGSPGNSYGHGGNGGGFFGGLGAYDDANEAIPCDALYNGITVPGSGGGQGGSNTNSIQQGAEFVGGYLGGTVIAQLAAGGSGAGSFYGMGGNAGRPSSGLANGSVGDGPGAGGGGAATYSIAGNGGNGGNGYLVVEWFK